jgi:hypothetical protein
VQRSRSLAFPAIPRRNRRCARAGTMGRSHALEMARSALEGGPCSPIGTAIVDPQEQFRSSMSSPIPRPLSHVPIQLQTSPRLRRDRASAGTVRLHRTSFLQTEKISDTASGASPGRVRSSRHVLLGFDSSGWRQNRISPFGSTEASPSNSAGGARLPDERSAIRRKRADINVLSDLVFLDDERIAVNTK